MPRPGETKAELERGHRRSHGPVHLAWCSSLYQVGQRLRVHYRGCQGLGQGGRIKDCLHRAGSTLGERSLRKL